MRGGDDDRHAAGDLLEREPHHLVALLVGQQELLREVRQDADAVDALVDHQVHDAPVALDVEVAIVVEDGRRDRQDALVGFGHGVISSWRTGRNANGDTVVRRVLAALVPRKRRAMLPMSGSTSKQRGRSPSGSRPAAFDQKIESEPWLKIIDWRKASSALSPMTMASTSGAIG